jgi:hypothetical protein
MTESSAAVSRRAVLRAIAAGGVLAASAIVAGCSAGNTQGGKPAPTSTTPPNSPAPGTLVMIIRHGEKPDKSKGLPGVDINGNPSDNSSLSQIGWERARALANIFDPPTGHPRPGLARPTLIYAARATDQGDGERTRETVTPLAQRLGIPINTDFGKGHEAAMAAEISSRPGPTLICWQHGEIPALAEDFGYLIPTPPHTWPDDRFDVIWTLTATGDRRWTFAQLPELALPTDRADTING